MAGDLEKEILKELNLSKNALEDEVQNLIDWLSKQPHLPQVSDEALLKNFIVGSKSVERAKDRIDKYFLARTKNPTLFQDRDPTTIQWEKVQKFFFLPCQTPKGETVLFFKAPVLKEEIERYSFKETIRAGLMLLDLKLRSPQLTSGHLVLIDCEKVTMEFLSKLVTFHTRAVFHIYQNAMPVRVNGCVCFNVPPLVEHFFNTVFKFFFNEKLQKRYAVYSDMKALADYVPLEILPRDYGGNSPPIDQQFERTKETLERNREWLLTRGVEVSDEANRPLYDNPNTLHGTFRKLEVD